MTHLIIETGELHATADPRVLEGLLLPYGEIGRTNLGRFSVDAGVFEIPTDPDVMTLNDDHARQRPVGRAVRTEERPDGLWAAFRFARTREGDEALASAKRADGRKRLSVEAADVVIRAGKAVAGRVYGAALVAAGAFPSATLLAADTPDQPVDVAPPTDADRLTDPAPNPEDEDTPTRKDDTVSTPAEAPPQNTPAPAPAAPTPAQPEPEAGHLAAALPVSIPQFAAPAATGVRLQIDEPGDLYAALAQANRNQDRDLFAALSDIKISGTNQLGSAFVQPAWLGKLWEDLEYIQRVVPLIGHKDLTALTVKGWRPTVRPRVAKWDGNKANVPSGPMNGSQQEFTAQRFAGGHDIAREFRDFSVPEFWEQYFSDMRESYAQEVDVYTLETLVAGATAVTPGASPDPEVSDAFVALVDAALAVNRKATPTFAVVADDVWRELVLTPHEHVLEYLSASLNLKEGSLAGFTIQPGPYRTVVNGTGQTATETEEPVLTSGQVLVGARNAADLYELPGSPIRVEGLDMVRGGIDTGLFGYALPLIKEPKALAIVTPAEEG
jgi:hypothetical protein